MSLFGALLGDFDDDGFMGNPINSMNMQMRNMNRLMSSMMMPDPFNMLTPFDSGFNSNNSLMERGNGGLFGLPSMPNMYRMMNGDMGGNGASFCSSSVISMSSGPDGRPQIYQATSSTKTGPGGIRETRKTVQDSTTGLKKMAIGHHIGERAHIIEKEQNLRSGQAEERQEFINLEEEEAENFDREFTNKARMHHPIVEITDGDEHQSPRHRSTHRALPAPPSAANTNSSTPSKSASATTTTSSASVSSSRSGTPTVQQTTTASTSSAAVRRAMRNASLVTPRRPLRTPISSPLALSTSGSSSASTTTSVHHHPYNNAVARRNFRSKHPKLHHHSSHQQQQQQQQEQPVVVSQPQDQQQQEEESPNNEI